MGLGLTVLYRASTRASDGTRNIDARNGIVWPQSLPFAIRHVTPADLAPATNVAISMRDVALALPSAALVALVAVMRRRYPVRNTWGAASECTSSSRIEARHGPSNRVTILRAWIELLPRGINVEHETLRAQDALPENFLRRRCSDNMSINNSRSDIMIRGRNRSAPRCIHEEFQIADY
jgi:hypothetical protein